MKDNALDTQLGKKVYAALPETARCRCCHRPRHKSQYGLRVMARGPGGEPKRIIRQSWCGRCRANRRY